MFTPGRTYRIERSDGQVVWLRVESVTDDDVRGWTKRGTRPEPAVIPLVEIETAVVWIEGPEGIKQRAATDPRD